MIDYQVHTLHNGIRLLFKQAASPVTHCCFMINAGARDEADGKDGLAHFIEHLLFKATERRNTTQILNRLEQVGADLNAYTTKEYTCLHASLLKQHLERALDLFEDLVFHSIFPQNELEKERGVILDEIASYLDQPEEAILDDFESILFKEHTLGNNILGSPASVTALNKEDIDHFIASNYNTSQMVFGISGDYDFNRLIKLFERYFERQVANNAVKHRVTPKSHVPQVLNVKKAITQTHCVIGGRAYASSHPHRYGLLLLNNLLGGMGMSNRLNLEIREKHGIAYTIESNYTSFTDTGIFSIYFGTDEEKAAKAMRLVHRELKKLRDAKLGAVQLQQAKQKFSAQIALGEENRLSLILSMCKSLLDFDRVDTLEEVFEKVHAVTAEQLLEISNEVLAPAALSILVFEPDGTEDE